MKMTLVYPAVGRKANAPYVRAWQMQPLSMALLASLTPPDVEIAFNDDRMEEIAFDEPADVAVISVETYTALRAYRIAEQFRMRGIPVVMGGYHATLLPEEVAQHGDAVVIGDAEPVWDQVIADARRGKLQPYYRASAPAKLAGLRPRRDLFQGKRYQNITLVESARGCNFRCDFCSITAYHQAAQHHRPAQEVAAEMEATGSRRFFIVDDNFVSQPAKARELCRELIPLNVRWVGQASIHIAHDDELLDLMAESGCVGILIGMESLDPSNLRDMGKSWNLAGGDYAESLRQFRKHGLAVYGTFVFGYDQDSQAIIDASVEFAREQKLFLAAFNHLTPFPGTPLYARLKQEGRLLKDPWWLDPQGRVGAVTFQPARMSPAELEQACLEARRKFYSFGSIAQRLCDWQVNAGSWLMLGVYLGLNIGHHFDIDLRQELQFGAGPLLPPAKCGAPAFAEELRA
jgi:radical SAM superfamily enzyme YgiQ (UPF0313 family)